MKFFRQLVITILTAVALESYGQNQHCLGLDSIKIKTVGLINMCGDFTEPEEQYFDSLLNSYYKVNKIRFVVIAGDTSRSRDKVFLKVFSEWGYTDTGLWKDEVIFISVRDLYKIGFAGDWIYEFVEKKKVDELIRTRFLPHLREGRQFDALKDFLKYLLREVEKGAKAE